MVTDADGHGWARMGADGGRWTRMDADGLKWVTDADGHGWARMGAGGGRGWTRMLVLVIIALGGKKEKKKTYLMNGPAHGCPLTRKVVVVAVDAQW